MAAALIVENDPLVRMHVVDVLAKAGILSYAVYAQEDALLILESDHTKICYLFINAEVPGKFDGFALARLAASRWPRMEIFAASNRQELTSDDLPATATYVAKRFSGAVVGERLKQLRPMPNSPVH